MCLSVRRAAFPGGRSGHCKSGHMDRDVVTHARERDGGRTRIRQTGMWALEGQHSPLRRRLSLGRWWVCKVGAKQEKWAGLSVRVSAGRVREVGLPPMAIDFQTTFMAALGASEAPWSRWGFCLGTCWKSGPPSPAVPALRYKLHDAGPHSAVPHQPPRHPESLPTPAGCSLNVGRVNRCWQSAQDFLWQKNLNTQTLL